MWNDLKMYWRFGSGLPAFLRRTIGVAEAREIIIRRLEEREDNFLRMLRKGVFGWPASPYLPLLQLAGCAYADIETMVRQRGLEGTLEALSAAGVYVTFEEFKGRVPLVRGGREFRVQNSEFDNPFLSRVYYARTSGSTGAGSRVPHDLDHLAAQAPNMRLSYEINNLTNTPKARWLPTLPGHAAINQMLREARAGFCVKKWFTPVLPGQTNPALRFRLATRAIIIICRLNGVPIPWPDPLPLERTDVFVRWAEAMLKEHGSCCIEASVSSQLRIANKAREMGVDLAGATLLGSGEPPTEAKVAGIKASGATWLPQYYFGESGFVGDYCHDPLDCNDLHFFEDILAIIQREREVPGFGVTITPFLFTSLLPTAPKILLNMESDDVGVLETRPCSCPWEAVGYRRHVREIRSFSKLTGEGVTLVGSEMIQILETVLPQRFGGGPLDYQLVEEEDEKGFTRLSLRVHPQVPLQNEQEVIDTLLQELKKSSAAADIAETVWRQAGAFRILREPPVLTAMGKFMPIYIRGRHDRVSRPD